MRNMLVYIVCAFVLITNLILNTHAASKNVNVQQLSTILSNMNLSADPCTDYFSYACGNWQREHLLEDYEETIGYIDHKTDQQFVRILKRLRQTKTAGEVFEHKFVEHALNYYKSCTNVEEYVPRIYLDLLEQMEDIVWPSMEGSRSREQQKFDWLKTLAILRKYGLNGILLEETVIMHRNNASTAIIDLDKPVLQGGFKPMHLEEFVMVLRNLGVQAKKKVAKIYDSVQNFEAELLQLQNIADENEDEDGYDLRTLEELNMPEWNRYLHILLDKRLPMDTVVSTQNLQYMRKLFKLLEAQDAEDIVRYLMLRFVLHLHKSGPNSFLKLDCISHVRSMLPMAMSWIYKQQYRGLNEDEQILTGIFQQLKRHFAIKLTLNPNRLQIEQIKFLVSKLSDMRLRVGNLPQNVSIIEQFYAHLELEVNSSTAFYKNHLTLLKHFTQTQHKLLFSAKALDENFFHIEDEETGASSSPYYLLYRNTVFVPLSLLQRPIYDRQLHDIYKYSSIGFLLAHEITHGFDESGIEYDRHGNLLGPGEYIKSNRRFNRSLSCLRGHTPQHIDERIADVGGLRLAYETYFDNNDVPKRTRPEWTDLPAEDLFFLNFAQFFCGTSAPKGEYSEHGDDSERVFKTLSNFEEFGQVHKCALGTRMNPERKCHLWR